MTPPELHILESAEAAARAAADFVAAAAGTQVSRRGLFTIALSGGSTPRRLYELLALPPHVGSVDWERWHVFWSDERCVPPDHQDSNYRMAWDALLDLVPVPAANIHRVRGEGSPAEAAKQYQEEVLQLFAPSAPAFDLVLLGLGEDGHTASLFAETDGLREKRRLVMANWALHLQGYRITFTFRLINAANAVAFLATERSKAEVVRQVLQPAPNLPLLPAALVRPTLGTVHWFLTRDAAALLK